MTVLGDWQVDSGTVFRTRFSATPAADREQVVLRFGGIATIAVVELNGEQILESESMWLSHEVDVGDRLRGDNELVIRCLPLEPVLAEKRKPRARWRTRLVDDNNLRWIRTSLLGRMPGIDPGPPVVGPWRPVTVERRGPEPWLRSLEVRPREHALRVAADVPGAATLEADLAGRRFALRDGRGEVETDGLERWYPHTHGLPVLHDLTLLADGEPIASRRVGLRRLVSASDPLEGTLDIQVNGVPVFVRGAVWTPVPEDELRATILAARDAGMNMLRIPGIGAYESDAFFDICDELGILVWQDFMFANMDYPIADDGFRASVESEARQVLHQVAGRACLAVLCGNSEVEQQVAMLGLDPELGRGELFGELLPRLAREADADVPYIPSAPSGGSLPMRFDRGVANYFGVGGYRRPLSDARAAGVRFASECLAFANVPDHDADWVPRDNGSEWDFADVREHYRALLHGDERSPEIDRGITGEVMAEVLGEWRRPASPTRGALLLWLRDTRPGQGWGVIDHAGRAKAAYHHVRRALAPIAVWMTDEGLAGIAVHVANDSASPLRATLRVGLYRDGEIPVGDVSTPIELDAHDAVTLDLEEMLGRFADASYAYRFGPPQHDVVVATLESDAEILSQAFRFPAGRPRGAYSAEELGLSAQIEQSTLVVASRRLAYGVRVHTPGLAPDDDAFNVAPGGQRLVGLHRISPKGPAGEGRLTAINLSGSIAFPVAE